MDKVNLILNDMTDTRLAIHLDRLLRRIHSGLHRKAPEFDTERIGPGGDMILLTLDETGPAPIHTLTERLVRDKSQMTRSLQSLERKGLITRAQSDEDSRVSVISLTHKGCEVVEIHQHAIAETVGGALKNLEPADKHALADLLAKATP